MIFTGLFIPKICFIGSCIFLFADYNRRKKFQEEFMKNKTIDNKYLIDGTISSNTPITSRNIEKFNFQNIIENNLFELITTYRQQKIGLYNHQFDKNSKIFRGSVIKINEYWFIDNIQFNYADNILFNGINISWDYMTNFDYPVSKKINFTNKQIIKKSIPNNFKISAFVKITNENKYIAEYIGQKNYIIDNIAYKYYNISSIHTLIGIMICICSGAKLYNLSK